jgi:replicative DNA helicase
MVDLVDVGCSEAGAALLGTALLGSGEARAAVEGLREADLSDVRQRAVLDAMRTLIERGDPIDPVTALGEMRATGSAARLPAGRECGVYLLDLLEQGMAGHPRHYLAIILEHGVRRVAREAGIRVTQGAGSLPLADLQAFVAQEAARVLDAAKRLEAVL